MTRQWRYGTILLLFLLVNSAYLTGFKAATVFYMANVLAHLVVGLALLPFAYFVWRRRDGLLPAALYSVAAGLGVYLMVHGNLRRDRPVLAAHIAIAAAAVVLVLPVVARGSKRLLRVVAATAAVSLALPLVAAAYRHYHPPRNHTITNRALVPTSMEEEGGGPKSPYWPSSTQISTHRHVPSAYFLDSAKCGECHREIYREWEHSAHHFASFNNQFYRKSIEYMQSVQHSTKPSQWCAACHDHAVLFSGRWSTPIAQQINTPEAQAGLGCLSCHAISSVDSTIGNAGFTMQYNALHSLASSRNPYLRAIDRFLTYVNPEPHRRTFLKPFMREQTSEFCSTCHKVHLDIPVNSYRWVRGFNDYDNWQASGVSGQGARSFYYPPKPMGCADCHMPEVRSSEPGSINGRIHSHFFAAANTAVPTANRDQEQLDRVEKFLRSRFLRVDIFAASPVVQTRELEMRRRGGGAEGPTLASTFAVGEESASQAAPAVVRNVGALAAPLERGDRVFAPGSTIRLDVVVRTLKVGHFFPGGTVDAQEAWLELQACDATGRVIFWSGKTAEPDRGPVEPGAHFYQSVQLDAEGNRIDKRNAWQTRSLLYVRLIPPGAADVAHFRVHLPSDVRGPITLRAKLNYRKFNDYYTKFSYAGAPVPGQDPTLVDIHHDSRVFDFRPENIPHDVSGAIKDHIPDLPIVTLASATTELRVGTAAPGSSAPWSQLADRPDRERWNDYGIGLLLQGDLKGAEFAFQRVIAAEPNYSDGYLNVARALIQEGEMSRAKPYIDKAVALNPSAGRNYYFRSQIEKTEGRYDDALNSLRITAASYPRDRVVLNQIGRIQFLKRNYAAALAALEQVLAIDPEDVQCHYNMMLCLRALGRGEEAQREEALFRRFKADESAQTITGRVRQLSPELNNSRQAIHDHDSVPVAALGQHTQD